MNELLLPYYQNKRAEVAALLPTQYARALEIGCGAGDFRGNLRPDCEYWGVEPLPSAADIAVTKLTRVIPGTFDDAFPQLPDAYFDLVICNDVIEHMTSHDDFLTAIVQKMTKGGFIVGSIPNVRYLPVLASLLVKKDWAYQNEGILDRTHLRFFTEKSLRRTLLEHGYEIEDLHGINRMHVEPFATLKDFIKWWAALFAGQDTLFLQLGFRVRFTGERKQAQPQEQANAVSLSA